MRIYLHINYFEQGYGLERALKEAGELGATGVEFRRVPLGSHSGAKNDYLDTLARALERHPVSEISFGAPGPNLTHAEPERRQAELESACSFYAEAARRFPVRVINLLLGELINPDKVVPLARFSRQGSSLATPEHRQWAVDGCRALAEVAKVYGFRFALETHGIYLHDTVEAACTLIERADRPKEIGVLWDRGNELLFDEFPTAQESLTRCRASLAYVHLKNILINPSGGYRICGLSEGEVDVRQQIKLLLASGYDGAICLESPRAGDRLGFLREDFRYLLDILREEGVA